MKKLLFILCIISTTIIYCETITHKVINGETLYGIANEYGVSYKDIIDENKLTDTYLKIDQVLNITVLEADKYIVKKGDSLSLIAFKNDITLKHLLLINRIDEEYKIRIGEVLTIPTTPEMKKSYTVNKGDTVSWISMTYNIEPEEILKINNLSNYELKIGQTLKLIDETIIKPEIKQASVAVSLIEPKNSAIENLIKYQVQKGDTLSGIALEYQTTIDDIIKENSLKDSSINIDQYLQLPSYAKKREPIDYNNYHIVEKGDSISGISFQYNISETVLREINNLESDKITVGQKIKLIPSESRTHTVQKGETLWSIAQKYNVSVDQLMQYNSLNSTIVSENRVLTLYDYSIAKHEEKDNISLISFKYKYETNESQPNLSYSIDKLIDPLNKYNIAKDNWKKFAELIDNEEQISQDLSGWTIILDPGHGGKDPGAIATVTLNGKKSYIVEDEYAYDTTVRLYELLKRNGAEVHMTVLSPDHITRNPTSNSTTFINEKNEVYNNYSINKINNSTIWPVGGQWGLSQRVNICNNLISTTKNNKTIFISIHADNDVDRGVGKLVLYSDRSGTIDTKSKAFADTIIKDLGDDGSTNGMTLAVLHENSADFKVLIELRNMAHLSDAMALLDNKKRQEDAQMILNGIKNYVNMKE